MNVWERAKAELRTAYHESERDTALRIEKLLAEMERVECVEGQRVRDGDRLYHFSRGKIMGGDWRPALLLLLPEEDR